MSLVIFCRKIHDTECFVLILLCLVKKVFHMLVDTKNLWNASENSFFSYTVKFLNFRTQENFTVIYIEQTNRPNVRVFDKKTQME